MSYSDCIDYYDFDGLEKLQEKRARAWIKLYSKMKKGDPKAKEAMRKHEEETDEIKKRARSVGYFWY